MNSKQQPNTTPPPIEHTPTPSSASSTSSTASEVSGVRPSRMLIILASFGVILVFIIVLFLALSAKNEDKADMSLSSQSNNEAEDKKTVAVEPENVQLTNKIITDPGSGYTITAKSLSIGELSIPAEYAKGNPGKTVLAVEFVNTDTAKVALSAKYLRFRILDADGNKYIPTSLSDADLKANAKIPLVEAIKSDDTFSGYVVFWVPTEKLDKLTLRYMRLASTALSSNETIPAKEFDLVLR